MPPNMRMNKVPEYPRPHNWGYNFAIPLERSVAMSATICPIITYDEGLGAMSAYESNPTNAAFVEAATDHCFPTSRVDRIFARLTVGMSKIMRETDKVPAVEFQTALIHTAFNEGALALDEISTLDLNEIMELDSESTDRQTFPLWNDIDLTDFKSNAALDMPAETPGLDTDLEIESVVFSEIQYRDCIQFMTNGKKLRSLMTPLRSHKLTHNNPTTQIYFTQQSNTKFLNPFTFLGALINIRGNNTSGQYGKPGDTTIDTCTLEFSFEARYNEYNHEFNHAMI